MAKTKGTVTVLTDDKKFFNETLATIDATIGMLKGVEDGKDVFLMKMAPKISYALGKYIDLRAREFPEALHHVYEWYKIGNSKKRLFKIIPVSTKNGIVFTYSFNQSTSLQTDRGSTVPFREKASIMEMGQTVHIEPNEAPYLVYFDKKTEEWVTSSYSKVLNPGGKETHKAFASAFITFFKVYLPQTNLMQSGMLTKPLSKEYRKAVPIARKSRGKRASEIGLVAGRKWIIDAADVEFE